MSVDIHKAVREKYGSIAESSNSTGCGCGPGCCGGEKQYTSTDLGYGIVELQNIPEGADLGLGCGNPTALADISPGETVIDLGSGAGIDCFLASAKTGETGKVIGVDMTPEMIDKARENAENGGYKNVEFRLGEIEHLPLADKSADLIISNCVVNLSPDKGQTFAEAYRVLNNGGRISVSDIVLSKPLPDRLLNNMALLTGCISGAMLLEEYLEAIKAAGFADVTLVQETENLTGGHLEALAREWGISKEDAEEIAGAVKSIVVRGVKQ